MCPKCLRNANSSQYVTMTPVGAYAVSGDAHSDVITIREGVLATCVCGWNVVGYIANGKFIVSDAAWLASGGWS